VILCKGAGRAEAAHERVVPCWSRESRRTHGLLASIPRFLGWRLGLGSAYDIEQVTFALNLVPLLRREHIDIVHVQDPQVAILLQRARRCGVLRARTILAHGTEEPVSFLQKIEYLQHLAPWHLDEALRQGAWRDTWTVIPNFVDTNRFRPGRCDALRAELRIPTEAIVVLSVSAIKRHHKRLDHLVNETARVRARSPALPIWLVVAGGWEQDTSALVDEAARSLGDRARFLVRFPRERMPDLYRAADAFVLASLKEMMPIALLEAAASGLPCLVHAHPVMQWMVGPSEEAVNMAAVDALAARLESLCHTAGKRQASGRQARIHCEALFARDRVVDQILRYYGSIMEERPGNAGKRAVR
jgi:glycosyltransferase involved in cell wall biosynthesis